jgi:hypothetical protein
MSAVLNTADSKASSKRAAIAAATDEVPIQLDSNPSNHRMSNNKLREDSKHLGLCTTSSRLIVRLPLIKH